MALLIMFFIAAARIPAAEPIAFDVCAQSSTWSRPSQDVQAKVWADRRYTDGQSAYEWTHSFLLMEPESASIHYHSINLAGLWTAKPEQWSCPNRRGLEWIEVWSLLHRVRNVRRDDNTYTITVEPVARGYQVIHFRRLNPSVVLRFVSADGKLLEQIIEGVTRISGPPDPPGPHTIIDPNGIVRKKKLD